SPDLRVALSVLVPDGVSFEEAESCLRDMANANPYVLGNPAEKIDAMQQAEAACENGCQRALELGWGQQALRTEQALDDSIARMTSLLDELHSILHEAEKGGLSD